MNRLLKYLMLACMAVLMAACSDSIDGGTDGSTDGTSTLYMRVSPADLAGRAGEDVSYLPDIDKMHSLRIVLLDATGRVEHNHHIDFTDPEVEYYYRFLVTTGNKQIFLIANEESVKGIEHEGATKTLTQMLDYYTVGMAGFADAINSVYFAPREGEPVPMSSKYDILVKRGENEATFYLVRSLVKFTFNFINKRTDDVQINKIGINRIADKGYLMAHVGDSDMNKEYVDKDNTKETLHWIDWLHKVSDESNTVPSNPENTTFNDRVGWITDYSVPTAASHAQYLIDFSANPLTIGAATKTTDEDGEEKIVATVVADNKQYYMSESKWLVGNDQQYSLTFNIQGEAGAFEVTKTLPNLRALFRNTFVIVDVTMTQIDLEIDVLPYTGVVLKPDFGLELPSLRIQKKNAKGEWIEIDQLDLYNDASSFVEVRAINKNGTNITNLVDWELDAGNQSVAGIQYLDAAGNVTNNVKDAASVKVSAEGSQIGFNNLTASYELEVGRASAEAMVVVADRHIFFPKTYIGLCPESTDDIEVEVVAEKNSGLDIFYVITTDIAGPDISGISNLGSLTQADFESEISNRVDSKSDLVSIEEVDGKLQVTSSEKEGKAYLHGYYLCKKNDGTYEILHGVCEIEVSTPQVYIRRTKAVIDLGASTSLVVQIRPIVFNKQQKVKFRSEDPTIATVDDYGVVTGVKTGTTRVICYNDEDFDPVLENSIEIEVRDNRLLLNRTSLQMKHPDSAVLTATFYENGEPKKVTIDWSLSDSKIAGITKNENNCTVTTQNTTGTALITAKYGDYTASCIVVVSTSISVQYLNCPPYLLVGDVLPCEATVFPNKNPDKPLTFTWSSSDKTVADFDTNVLTAKKAGTTIITAKCKEYPDAVGSWSLLVK